MPKPIPDPPDYEPTPEVLDVMERARAIGRLPAGATADQHAEAIRGLQWLQNEMLREWLRTLARAQGVRVNDLTWDAGAVSHRVLVGVTGYSNHRNVQNRVYEGRKLINGDLAAAAEHREVG